MIIGIDLGLEGGLALLTEEGDLVDVIDMPVFRARKPGTLGVDAHQLRDQLVDWKSYHPDAIRMVYIERPMIMPRQSATSGLTVGLNAGAVLATVSGVDLGYEVVSASTWKKKLGLTSDKKAAVEHAARLWPLKRGWFYTQRGRALDGRAEAALIGYWATK